MSVALHKQRPSLGPGTFAAGYRSLEAALYVFLTYILCTYLFYAWSTWRKLFTSTPDPPTPAHPRTMATFAEAAAVTQLTPHTYSAHFPEDWCIGTVPHGGFVTTVFLRVAEAHFSSTLSAQNQPHTISLHLDFLRRTEAGPALFTVQDKKLGRQATVIHITLSQSSREEVVGYITNSNMKTEEGISISTEFALHPAPLPVDLTLLSQDKDSNWGVQENLPFAGWRKATEKTQFHFPRAGQIHPRMADEWIRLQNGERWTNSMLGYVSDMWLMPIESFITRDDAEAAAANPGSRGKRRMAKFWYPTVLLNLDIKKALPEEGVEWLFSRVETKQIKNGRMDLEVVIMDAEGDIVALSHHVALAVSAQRNIAERKTSAKI